MVDAYLGRLTHCLDEHDSVIVTTDHGGLGNHHELGRPEDIRTFIVMRSPKIAPTSYWTNASILNVAPSVAELAGFGVSEY